jgi:acetate kinase
LRHCTIARSSKGSHKSKTCADPCHKWRCDTGLHATLPDAAAVYPGPHDWLQSGIRKFGFHGINHQYCAGRTAELLGRNLADLKLVTCHLANGCSLAAIRGGVSIDTTMDSRRWMDL